ncbi:MAG: exodeoxyribonuclease VII large subunit, partial [Xanthomonadaceae bacterium]|nr:exodeoxyribonuclease VII large subunit [Xanthomonadaceae bacterium]
AAVARARLDALHPRNGLALRSQRLGALRQRLLSRIAGATEPPARRLAALARALNGVSPLATLDRGYAIVRGPDGRSLREAAQAPAGTPLRIDLAQGSIAATSRGPWPAD